MAITVYQQETMNKFKQEKPKKNLFGFFSSKRPELESRNSGDHELFYHEMQGSPVVYICVKWHADWKLSAICRLPICHAVVIYNYTSLYTKRICQ